MNEWIMLLLTWIMLGLFLGYHQSGMFNTRIHTLWLQTIDAVQHTPEIRTLYDYVICEYNFVFYNTKSDLSKSAGHLVLAAAFKSKYRFNVHIHNIWMCDGNKIIIQKLSNRIETKNETQPKINCKFTKNDNLFNLLDIFQKIKNRLN